MSQTDVSKKAPVTGAVLPVPGKASSPRFAGAPYALILPLTIFVAVLFVYPLVQMALTTLVATAPDGSSQLTFDPFVKFFSTARGGELVARTLRIALVTTVATLVLAYPVTLWIREVGPKMRGILIVLLLSPMLTSDVVRSLGWVSILGPNGVISEVFKLFGLTAPRILYTEGAVVVGLTQIFLGYMVLSLLSSILRIPDDVISAAANLGANSAQILGRVVLPMSVPGIVGGCAIVFPLAASTYVTAALLGGTSNPVMGTELYRESMVNLDWGSASAIGLTLFGIIVIVMILVGIIARVASRRAAS